MATNLRDVVTDEPTMDRKKRLNIGIIGAGVAGLRCASVLLDHGHKVTIIEGRNRLGGRLAQVEMYAGGPVVDLGPNWIHGTKDNPIYELVKQTNTITCGFEQAAAVFDRQGQRVGTNVAGVASEVMWETIGKATEYSVAHKDDGSIPAHLSLMDYMREHVPEEVHRRLSHHDFAKGEITEEQLTDLVLAMADIWGPYVGSTTEKQSLKYLWLEESLGGENLFCAGTYQKVLQHITQLVTGRAKIFSETLVKSIVGKSDADGNREVRVIASDGRKWLFDEVVMTAPLGWLKRNLDCFQVSALPDGFQNAVDTLGYGMLDKVYLTFPEAFWENRSAPSSESATSSDNTSSKQQPGPVTVPISSVSSPESNADSPSISTFLQPSFLPEDSHLRHLTQDALHLTSLPAPVAHPTLLFYTTDPTTAHLSSLVPKSRRSEPYHIINPSPNSASSSSITDDMEDDPILKALKPLYALLALPSSSPHQAKIPSPTALLFTNWYADTLAGNGSYTYFPCSPKPTSSATLSTTTTRLQGDNDDEGKEGKEGEEAGKEQAELDKCIETLRKGMPDEGIWIAGEHTAPFVALGTVTGAWMSGEKVAMRIVKGQG